jgi:glutamate---cysteine ligase / carboxylate-amine ligase
MRTVGVEEEFLLVDPESGHPLPVSEAVLRYARTHPAPGHPPSAPPQEEGEEVEAEFQRQQVEIHTCTRSSLLDLRSDLREARGRVNAAAADVGAAIAALGTSPQPVRPVTVPSPRYERILRRYGLTAEEHLTCACHVHVGVESEEEGVGVLDRIRTWLPVLVALSASSPFWQGRDSRYASYRTQAMSRWPATGPTDLFGSARAYHRVVDDLVGSGALLDVAMVYFDARLSHHLPTVEVRVADVCTDVRDAVMLAGLVRALVETEARAWAEGRPPSEVPTALVRAAAWQAARFGLDDELLLPQTCRAVPADEVVHALLDHVQDALGEDDGADSVADRVDAVLTHGSSARRQRRVHAQSGRLRDVVRDAVRLTAGEDE